MPTKRLYSPLPLTEHARHVMGAEQAHYVGKVMRQRPGDTLRVFDGSGGEFTATIAVLSKSEITVQTGAQIDIETESPLRIHLLQGVSRSQRMDFVVQKATELGVQHISPILTEFSVIRLGNGRADKKQQHWQKVAVSACEQSGRNRLPHIDRPQTLHDWLQNNSDGNNRILLVPNAEQRLNRDIVVATDVTVLIGPEGGLSDTECEQAISCGFRPVSLGPRVLRTETAALATVVALQVLRGDFC